MLKMFWSLEELGLRGFMGVSGSVYENALQKIGSAWRRCEEGDIPEAVGTIGDVGGSGAAAQAARTDEGMAAAGSHLEDSFVHCSGGPATTTIEIREITWTTHFLPNTDSATKGKEPLEEFERPSPFSEQCIEVLKDIHEQVESVVTQFDEGKLFRTEDGYGFATEIDGGALEVF
ncbi:cell wall [Dorcoceras hygrometricum]|uniref:Cell wall n=1 Tax=Dorcoceras hygrometricum TaxID=472368 RepID=A0A2Z7BYT4_9LAMI|nr:cell wall [Dorcoceras hygrometricum]